MFQRLRSGTTVVSVLLQGKTLTVGWLGDSQVVLCRDGQAYQLMEPHKPENVVNDTSFDVIVTESFWYSRN